MEPTKAAPMITDIQVLRGVAIVLVLAYHLSLSRTLLGFMPIRVEFPGWVGVEMFFVISGLVVTQSVMRSWPSAKLFLLKRAFRLIPAIVFFLLVSGGVALLALILPAGFGRETFGFNLVDYLWQSAAILGGYLINRPGGTHYMNGAMWSLSVEFQFYLAFAGVLSILTAIKLATVRARTALLVIAAVLFILALVDRFGLLIGSDPVPFALVDYLRRFRFDFMLLGLLLAMVPATKISWGPAVTPYLVLVPMALVAVSEDQLGPGLKPVLEGFTTPVMALCFAALIYLACTNSAFVGQGSRAYRVMLWVGERSYSIYLLHFPLMALAWMGIAWLAPQIFYGYGGISYGVAQVALVVPATMLAANFSHEKVEGPFKRYGARWLKDLGRR